MIHATDVFRVFQDLRDNAIVITTGTAGRHWMDFSANQKRDLMLGGAMGHTTAASFGVALSLPNEKVVLFDSEGALLMNLGILATIAGKQPQNFYHFLMDNECYATTTSAACLDIVAMDAVVRRREAQRQIAERALLFLLWERDLFRKPCFGGESPRDYLGPTRV